VSLRTALGQALYRLPAPVRGALPRNVREGTRRRVGPFAPWEAGFPHIAPALENGERSGPPEFVGIGVQKAGTTWWFNLVVAHPEVFHRGDIHKERHYFARYATETFDAAAAAGYRSWFPRRPGTVTGEWTPDYLYQPWVPPLLDEAAPEARLLAIVRDPVERFVSGVTHSEIVPASHLGTVTAEALWRGFYAASLRWWSAALDSGRMLVLQYERCVADPEGELARTYRFLELDDSFRPLMLRQPHSTTRNEKVALTQAARRRLCEIYRDDVDDLAARVPDFDVSLWPNFKKR
jgi:hypothetical protein